VSLIQTTVPYDVRAPLSDLSLLDSEGPVAKLRDLAEAALHPSAMDYKLQTSILLKGSRGIGKLTATSWVARSLGIHLLDVCVPRVYYFAHLIIHVLLQINCFDVAGENDAQTEGTLRARFDKAASCAPCILTLRHIDALAGTTQPLETGKGRYHCHSF
jgi:peroxin-6